ncbi:unnamed protein product [Vicia faba]|uniref:Uncharacterized protein n=1 Tax=Vicia faba TaxID=3906 RepID=A0AAV0ZAW8_VICFA|nr:unnamed protein product [Vicia faba]
MSKRQESAGKAKTFALDASKNVLAASSQLDAYYFFLLWHLSHILHPLREPFFQLSFNSSKDPPLGIKTSKANTHLYVWLPSSTEHLLSWRWIKFSYLLSSVFIRLYAIKKKECRDS